MVEDTAKHVFLLAAYGELPSLRALAADLGDSVFTDCVQHLHIGAVSS